MNSLWTDFTNRDMTRKEFLRHAAIAVILALNLGGIISFLTGHHISLSPYKPVEHGYSSDGYSGFIGAHPPEHGSKDFDG